MIYVGLKLSKTRSYYIQLKYFGTAKLFIIVEEISLLNCSYFEL